jgi:hypothetical protein
VSPILVRPVREQLEHDRLIRFLLLNKYKRKYEAVGNPGDEHAVSIKLGNSVFFPDIVLTEGKKLVGLVEVETGESGNNLEALAQWMQFAKARVAFHLYVPVTSYDSARRLCELHHTRPAEIWTYRASMDGFDLMRVQQNPITGGGRAATVERIVPTPKPVEKPPEKPVGEKPAEKTEISPKAAAKGAVKPAPTLPPARPGTKPAGAKVLPTPKAVTPAKVANGAQAGKPAKAVKPVEAAKVMKLTKSAKSSKPQPAQKSGKAKTLKAPTPKPAKAKTTKTSKKKR